MGLFLIILCEKVPFFFFSYHKRSPCKPLFTKHSVTAINLTLSRLKHINELDPCVSLQSPDKCNEMLTSILEMFRVFESFLYKLNFPQCISTLLLSSYCFGAQPIVTDFCTESVPICYTGLCHR